MTNRISKSCASLWLLIAALAFSSCGGSREAKDPAERIPGWRTYYNRDVGIELEYPYTLQLSVEDAEPGQVSLDLEWVGHGMTRFKLETFDPEMETVIRSTQRPDTESTVKIGVFNAARIDTLLDGEEVQRVLITRGNRLYVFTGKGEIFDEVLATVKFIDISPSN